jgi:hypothetical protein
LTKEDTVAKGVFVVQSSALDAEHESAFDEWYHSVHIPEILDVPGFIGARRFRIVDGAEDAHPFLTIYEIEADDVRAPLQEMYRRAQAGDMSIPDHVMKAKAPSTILYELTGEY